jgi:hypothetical protein
MSAYSSRIMPLKYPPRRRSACLTQRSETLRAIACQSDATRRSNNPAPMSGIAMPAYTLTIAREGWSVFRSTFSLYYNTWWWLGNFGPYPFPIKALKIAEPVPFTAFLLGFYGLTRPPRIRSSSIASFCSSSPVSNSPKPRSKSRSLSRFW